MATYVYVELKTQLTSGSIRTVPNYRGNSYALIDAVSGDFILQLPPEVTEIRPGQVLYEDAAIRVRT